MNPPQIHSAFKLILQLLSVGKIVQSMQKTRILLDELQVGEYVDKLNELEQNYKYLLHYFANDINDPERKIVYNRIVFRLFVLNSTVREELFFRNSSGFEYTQKRYFPHRRRFADIDGLMDALSYFYSQSDILNENTSVNQPELFRLRRNYDELLGELFEVYWLTTFYNVSEKKVFTDIISNPNRSFAEKSLLVSALTLNLWRMFDEQKLQLLFDCCNSTDLHVKQRAIVGLCFILVRYNRFMPFFPTVRNRLVIMADDNRTFENFKNIFIQIISTSDTDKITRKMQEEILPEVMKISPMIKDKIQDDTLLRSDEWDEENPEWQEMLEKSGVSEKLRELSELQMEGADVYMSTFSMLKSFPFFSNISNWFLPFDPQNSAVTELFATADANLLTAFAANNMMCNSDKYSFCLSVLQMPEFQRNNIKQTFKAESEQLSEMASEEAMLQPDIAAKHISKHYIQDLFRFFRLFPQSKDFSDMFKSAMLMHKSYVFDMLSAGSDLKTNVAEYLFAKGHYPESIELFDELKDEEPVSALVHQKLGYAYQKTQQLDNALDEFLKADLIQPDDLWTIKKIAFCYRLKGDFTKAIEYYRHADFVKPEQRNVSKSLAGCFADAGNYKEALNIYLKLNEEAEDVRLLREIVWCSFMSDNVAGAEYYSDRVLELDPRAQDYLYAGHFKLCKSHVKEAVVLYRKSYDLYGTNDFEQAFIKEKETLAKFGVDSSDLALVLEAVINSEI